MKKTIATLQLTLAAFGATFGATIQQSASSTPRIAVALAGGGALGYAHIGVLQAFDEAGIKPVYIAGTSMGAIVGVLYAQGFSGNELYDFVVQKRLYTAYRNVSTTWRHMNRGIGTHKNVVKLFREAIPHNSFDSLAIPFVCVATHIRTGQPVARHSGGDLHSWVLASASIPVIFQPMLIDGEYYCDGGLTDNLPAQYIPREAYDLCIGVDLVPTEQPTTEAFFGPRYLANDVYFNMVININSRTGREICHHIIHPHHDCTYGILSFRNYEALRKRGYDATMDWLRSNGYLQ